MTNAESERARIIAIISKMRDQAIRDYSKDPQDDAAMGLALIGTYQECIDAIQGQTDV